MTSPSEAEDLQAVAIGDSSRLWSPGKLALDGGAVYAVDGYKNRVQKLDSGGSLLQSLKIDQPSAVAAGSGGILYIGSHRDYSVAVYKQGRLTGFLGDGKNEFSSILDIAVDQTMGDVYVVDGVKNVVKVYASSGSPKASFFGFNAPLAVAVTDDEVYVLDAPVTATAKGQGTGSRISIFSKSGAPLRSIDERTAKDGAMRKPVDIAVDARGNIFIADAGRNGVLVYDTRGECTGMITGEPFRSSVALALSRDGRLYVSSSDTHSIVEVGLAGSVSSGGALALDFQSMTGGRLTPAALGY
jgi:hypothetical protein